MAKKENSHRQKSGSSHKQKGDRGKVLSHGGKRSAMNDGDKNYFRFLSDSALMGIAILQDDVIKYANHAIADILEYSIDEMKAWAPKEFAKVIHPDFREFVMEQAKRKQSGIEDVVTQYEYKITTGNNKTKWVDQYSKTIQYEGKSADYITMIETTKRKNAESALHLSEIRYRELFAAAMEGIAIVDENEVIQFCNPAFVNIFDEESYLNMVGRSLYEYIPEDQKGFMASLTAERSRNISSRYEIKIRTAKNNEKIVRVSASPRFDKSGHYIGAFGTVIDHTERRNAERALKESIQSYQTLAENLPGLVFRVLCRQGNRMKFFNDHLKTMTGYTEDELKVEDICSIIPLIVEEDRSYVESETKYAIEYNKPLEINYRIRHKNGDIRHMMERSQPILNSKNELQSIDGVIFDVTHQRQAEESLKEAHAELERQYRERTKELEETNLRKKAIFDLYSIFELSRNFNAMLDYKSLLDSFVLAAIGRMGAKGAALYLPPELEHDELRMARAEGSFSFPDKDTKINQSEPCCQYITSMNRPVQIEEIRDKFKSSESLEFLSYFPKGLLIPLVFQTKLRGLLILSEKESKLNYHDDDIEFLSILASQTAVSIENARLYESEREALSKLQSTQKLLVQSERSAALGDLSAKIAHEINNPLGIIKNYLHLTGKNLDSHEKALSYTKIIKQEIDRIALIVKQLLDFHRPVSARFENVHPRQIVDETISLMERQLTNARIQAKITCNDNVHEISVWLDGLKQVFINLLVNSIDAIGHDGEIDFRIEKSDHTVIFTFEDTGPGIDPEHIPHIFEPYYTTKMESGGSGLGLSICHNIIKNHNGSISFTNTDRGGSFRIELPIEHEETEYDWKI